MISNKAQQFCVWEGGEGGEPIRKDRRGGGVLKKRVRYFQLTLSSDWNSLL